MAVKAREASNLEIVDGSLCLDFVNKVSKRSRSLGKEYIMTCEHLAG